MDNTFENHSSFNRHLSIDGNRVSTIGAKPSNYITTVKLKRAVKELSDIDIEEIFDKEMNEVAIKYHREMLLSKSENLLHWQYIVVLNILLKEGNYDAVEYLKKSKRTDKQDK
ncbi:MAG: hypothetical protein Q8L81_07585 [Bacteroidota bacterium]|nr:hypothetical protein [Bacteroidota bacterium]